MIFYKGKIQNTIFTHVLGHPEKRKNIFSTWARKKLFASPIPQKKINYIKHTYRRGLHKLGIKSSNLISVPTVRNKNTFTVFHRLKRVFPKNLFTFIHFTVKVLKLFQSVNLSFFTALFEVPRYNKLANIRKKKIRNTHYNHFQCGKFSFEVFPFHIFSNNFHQKQKELVFSPK